MHINTTNGKLASRPSLLLCHELRCLLSIGSFKAMVAARTKLIPPVTVFETRTVYLHCQNPIAGNHLPLLHLSKHLMSLLLLTKIGKVSTLFPGIFVVFANALIVERPGCHTTILAPAVPLWMMEKGHVTTNVHELWSTLNAERRSPLGTPQTLN